MTVYSNPNLTQREMVEQTITALDTLIATIETAMAEVATTQDGALDYQTAQKLNNHSNILNGSKIQLTDEKTRLAAIVAGWDAVAE